MIMAESRKMAADGRRSADRIEGLMGALPDRVEEKLRGLIEEGAIETGQLTPQYLAATITTCLDKVGLPDLMAALRNGAHLQTSAGAGPAGHVPPAQSAR